ncbi:hypothetical protein QJS10_CPA03g00436 [Acorus calamus]|uniref:Uncharacterized protein n=1 Tax=Acorus calamus TaxID=4465 RepID=A0AAV9F6E4_ACOCL|nr:hypothetical protein QJS10_CPA03g00436 [Acorus calamus]
MYKIVGDTDKRPHNSQAKEEEMKVSFVLALLIVGLFALQYGFVHGEVMARKLGGRVRFSPPSPQPNMVKHHNPPETPGGGPPSTHG